ncbi:MAG: hypothetical protein FJX60_02080 [Alphaproteobacteria bacterium]|nr:hypothetical protein [Alphaproteobacteria bacterium]
MSETKRQGADRRLDPRVRPKEGWLLIDGRRFEVWDVSASGLLIRPYAGEHKIGASFDFRLHLLDLPNPEIVIDGGAVVVRINDKEMAAQFFHLDSGQYPAFDAFLERQFQALISERASTR